MNNLAEKSKEMAYMFTLTRFIGALDYDMNNVNTVIELAPA